MIALAGALVFVTVGLSLYFIVSFIVDRGPSMASMISPYAKGDEDVPDGPHRVQLAETQLLRRAVEATHKLATERGLGRIEQLLERADAPVRAAEAFFFTLAGTVIATLLAFVVFRTLVPTVAVMLGGFVLPLLVLKVRIIRRQRKFMSQLPDTLNLLAGSLRAGYSLLQAVETVAHEVRDPMGKELGLVLTESRLGRPLEEALTEAAERLGSKDFEWAVMAIGIQREVGGNLAELLSTVADTMVARERVRREVRSLTAEGRMTGIVLAILPIAIGIALSVINPGYMTPLFTRSIGKMVLGGSLVLALVGFAWMKKIVTVEA